MTRQFLLCCSLSLVFVLSACSANLGERTEQKSETNSGTPATATGAGTREGGLVDRFGDNRNGWPVGDQSSQRKTGTASVGPDEYVIDYTATEPFLAELYPDRNLEAPAGQWRSVSVDVQIVSDSGGSEIGLGIFDADGKDDANRIVFLVSDDAYFVGSRKDHNPEGIIGETKTGALVAGGKNRLMIRAGKAAYDLIINGDVVSQIDMPILRGMKKMRFGLTVRLNEAKSCARFVVDNYVVTVDGGT